MLYHSICRLFLCLFITVQIPVSFLVAQPSDVHEKSAIAATKKQENGNKNPQVASSDTKKERNSGLWISNPLVQAGAFVAFLYAGGAVVAASIYYQVKDLFPENKSYDNSRNDEDDCE